jgi:hypothetical protein
VHGAAVTRPGHSIAVLFSAVVLGYPSAEGVVRPTPLSPLECER